MSLNDEVRNFWEQEPCGTSQGIVGDAPQHTRDWFENWVVCSLINGVGSLR